MSIWNERECYSQCGAHFLYRPLHSQNWAGKPCLCDFRTVFIRSRFYLPLFFAFVFACPKILFGGSNPSRMCRSWRFKIRLDKYRLTRQAIWILNLFSMSSVELDTNKSKGLGTGQSRCATVFFLPGAVRTWMTNPVDPTALCRRPKPPVEHFVARERERERQTTAGLVVDG